MAKATVEKPSRTTLNDVATRAGVSVTTASLVLAEKGLERRISGRVQDRVRKAAADLDYAPNLLVRSMQRGRTHVLSFLNGFRQRSTNDLYMDRLSTALERAAGAKGYDLLIHCDFQRSVEDTYRLLNGGRADALLFFAPAAQDPLLNRLRASRLPTVLVNSEDDRGVLSSVKDDQEAGIRQAAAALLAAGHARIAALVEPEGGNPDAIQRLDALRARLRQSGVELPSAATIPVRNDSRDDHEAALRTLLSLPEPPTALFCWRDHSGYCVLDACDHMGISVPDELSLVGYDGLRWPTGSRHVLASVHVDMAALAEAAVDLAVLLIDGVESGPVRLRTPVSFDPGTTLGPR